MPAMISCRRSSGRSKRESSAARARVTGCCGSPRYIAATSLRHHASLVRATPVSVQSSTTSSTSRQNA